VHVSRPAPSAAGGWRTIARELSAFGIVGALCFALDLGLFQVLYAYADVNAVAAKLVSTLVSMTVAYAGHRYWSFSHRERTAVRRSYALFAAVNATTLSMGLLIVWFVRYPLGQESALVLQAANIFSIALGTVIRFRSYRRWVFPAPRALIEAAAVAPPTTSAVPERNQV
jgi:putative flippase GtrA